MVVQWLGLITSTAGGPGLILGWGTKIPQACSTAKKGNENYSLLGFDNLIENIAF